MLLSLPAQQLTRRDACVRFFSFLDHFVSYPYLLPQERMQAVGESVEYDHCMYQVDFVDVLARAAAD